MVLLLFSNIMISHVIVIDKDIDMGLVTSQALSVIDLAGA